MTKLEKFIEANPSDPRVVRVIEAMDKSFSVHSRIGRLIGELMREAEEAY